MKRMKKLIAALMAVAMIASLNISAFATQTTPAPFDANTTTNITANVPTAGDVNSNGEDETIVGNFTASNGFTETATDSATIANGGYSASANDATSDKARASITSPVAYEGKMPEGVVHIVMPAVPATAFNMLLDPNDLIGEVAKGGESSSQRLENITPNTSYVYFANDNDGEVSYSNSSDTLTITNKGYWPLKVKLTAEVQKGDTADKGALIQMVDNKTKLAPTNETYKNIPAMYMEVKSGTNTGVVADAYGTPSMVVSGNSTNPQLIVGNPIFAWGENILNRDRKILNKALDGVAFTVAAADQTSIAAVKFNTNSAIYDLSAAAAVFTVKADGSHDNSAAATGYKVWITTGTAPVLTGMTASKQASTIMVCNLFLTAASATAAPTGSSAKPTATVTLAIDPVNLNKYSGGTPSVTPAGIITFGQNKSNSTGSISTSIIAPQNAYVVSYENGAYVKTLSEAAKDEAFTWPELSFNISAAINKTTAWDDLVGSSEYTVNTSTGVQTKVIWDVQNNYDGDKNEPKVKVLKYAVNAGDLVEFKFDFGKGSSAALAVVALSVNNATQTLPTYGAVSSNAIADVSANNAWQTYNHNTNFAYASGKDTGTTDGMIYQLKPGTVTATSTATLTYLKIDSTTGGFTTGTVTFTIGAANA